MRLVLLVTVGQAVAQEQHRLVQVSGIVATGDSLVGIEGAAVYTSSLSRKTTTSNSGFFSMPVLIGDTVHFKSLGFQEYYLVIPSNLDSNSHSVVIYLQSISKLLPTVEVIPWATTYEFRQALLRVKVPPSAIEVNFGPTVYKSVLAGPTMDAVSNFRHSQQQHIEQFQRTYLFPSIVRFISFKIR
ncbi:MAG: hypothetical protein LPK03_12175 [Pontibacter sp.]|nr:hypothetical protein [Pontibacter sp.]